MTEHIMKVHGVISLVSLNHLNAQRVAWCANGLYGSAFHHSTPRSKPCNETITFQLGQINNDEKLNKDSENAASRTSTVIAVVAQKMWNRPVGLPTTNPLFYELYCICFKCCLDADITEQKHEDCAVPAPRSCYKQPCWATSYTRKSLTAGQWCIV